MISLAGPNLLDDLTPAARARLAEIGQRRQFRDQELIHSAGDPAYMAIVIEGAVRLCRIRANGTQTMVTMVLKGQNVGDLQLFSRRKVKTHDAFAIGDTVLDVYDERAFRRVLEIPEVMIALYRTVALRLMGTMEMNDDLRSLPREVHLAKTLMAMHTRAKDPSSLFCLQEDLAGVLGVTTMTVSKCLANLKQQGFVETGYRWVRVTDPVGLRGWLNGQLNQ